MHGLPPATFALAVFSAGIGGTFQYGYNLSIINAPTLDVQAFINETWSVRIGTNLDSGLLKLLWSIIVSIFTLGGFLGAWLGGHLTIKFGRKGTLLLVNVLTLAGSALMGTSKPAGIFELLIVGRFLVGLHSGVSLCVQPMYLGEIAPKAWRGAISMGSSIFITLGILTGQVIGQRELLGREQFWHILLSTVCIPALLQLLLLPWFPESPRHLFIDKGLEAKALQSLRQLHGVNSYLSELEDIEKEQVAVQLQQSKTLWELLTDRATRWQLITVVTVNVGQQLSGINAIYFYATYVFNKAGIAQAYIPYVTMGTGACECLSALCCGLMIECLGRRVLILGGYSLMAVWCTLITLTLTYQASYFWMPYMTMTFLFAFILSFGLGPGGVTNIVTGELFTQTARPAAYMASGSMNWLSFFLISITFPFIVESMQHFCFLVFLVECLLITLFVYIVLPETKNKSFVEIEKEFRARNFRGVSPTVTADGDVRDVRMSNF
ncbi:solute carrier family 2, facilitated glucose transporter member 11b isoform X2 [Pristis pectinata]|uniref:solute carrier family 2, facilitated glucose transporter member 11b isoform X2 n=1 Tax=Pristis pectinata TaxID=685728 RepID=UPI00223E3F91|nr:solute carrier family 2, facilitated glucose transporter member 11b isoform X2 [Pristis pectinata]